MEIPCDKVDKPVELVLRAGQVPFVLGGGGIGKTAAFARIAERMGVAFSDITLHDRDLSELRLPHVIDGVMHFASDRDWPLKKYEHLHPSRGILLIDEITGCDAIMQRPIWRLARERKLGTEELLDGWMIALAGNRLTDRADANAFSFPLANRLVHIHAGPPTPRGWAEWAIVEGLSGYVVGYLRHSPASLYKVDLDRFDAGVWAQPTPRSWEMVGQILNAAKDINSMEVDQAVSGAIGAEEATKALGWMRVHTDLPDIREVLAGRCFDFPKSAGGRLIVCASLAAMVEPKTMKNLVAYANKLSREYKAAIAADVRLRGSKVMLAEGFADLL
jgi:hypothetical protein